MCSSNGAGLPHSSGNHIVRGPLDDEYIRRLVLNERKHLVLAGAGCCCAAGQCAPPHGTARLLMPSWSGCCWLAGLSLVVCSACNLASPVISGILFEILTGRQPMSRYPPFLAALAAIYIIEPLLTRVYIQNVCTAGEKVLSCLPACQPGACSVPCRNLI